jgi:uncharacterized protein YggE
MKQLVLLACVIWPLSLFGQGGLPDQPYIYVEGKAEIEKAADIVTLRFDLVGRNPDQAKANQEVQAKANKIFGLLKEGNIAENDVIAADLKSEPQYENNEESGRKRGKIIGYAVTRSFTATVRNVTAFPKLVDELLAITGIEFSGIDTRLSKEKEIQDEIWDKALKNAHERAEKTLQAVGMKIDSIFALSPVAFPEIRQKILGYEQSSSLYTATEGLRALPQYRLAPVSINQSVHVIYLIAPAQ